MFMEFVGQFFCMTLAKIDKDRLQTPEHLSTEQDLAAFMAQPGASENVITILSPMRVHKGIMINHVNSDENHACHEASIIMNKSLELIEPVFQPEIALPYLYLITDLFSRIEQNEVLNMAKL